LKRVTRRQDFCEVRVNSWATRRALRSELLVGRSVIGKNTGFLIEWIGPGGEVLSSHRATRSRYRITDDHAYVRARVSFTRQTPEGHESFFAWTQPVFTDGRSAEAHVER